jgi:hypothetical protein
MRKYLVIFLYLIFCLPSYAYENLYEKNRVRLDFACGDLKSFKKNVSNMELQTTWAHKDIEWRFNKPFFENSKKIEYLIIFTEMITNLANRDILLKKLFTCSKFKKKFSVGFANLERRTAEDIGWKPIVCAQGKSCAVEIEEFTLAQMKAIDEFLYKNISEIENSPRYEEVKTKLKIIMDDMDKKLIFQKDNIKKKYSRN